MEFIKFSKSVHICVHQAVMVNNGIEWSVHICVQQAVMETYLSDYNGKYYKYMEFIKFSKGVHICVHQAVMVNNGIEWSVHICVQQAVMETLVEWH